MGDNISAVEGIQYSGGYFQYSGGYLQYNGGNISTAEVARYSGVKYYEFSKESRV